MTKVFFKSLIDDAFLWYQELPNDKVQRFQNLANKFVQEYKLIIKHDTTLGNLYKTNQLLNQKFSDFKKVWKTKANETIAKQDDLKEFLLQKLLPTFKEHTCNIIDNFRGNDSHHNQKRNYSLRMWSIEIWKE